MPSIVPNLWFDGNAEEAAAFYCGIFPNSGVTGMAHYTEAGPGEPGSVMTVSWELDGQAFVGINGGPLFPFTEAISLLVECADQAEIDHYWDALTAGGQESQCGWLKDRYGVSWQIAPKGMDAFFAGNDAAATQRAMEAMLGITKLVLADLEAARRG